MLIILFLLVLSGVVVWWLRRRQSQSNPLLSGNYVSPPANTAPSPMPAMPTYQQQVAPQAAVQPISPPQAVHHGKATAPLQPPPAHMGESLRDMVIQSMADEAAHNPHQGPKPPVVPGG